MLENLKRRRWTSRFRRQCSSVGVGLSVLGPCEFHSEGTVKVGDGLLIRSRKYNPVEISCASTGKLSFGNNVFLNQGVRIACTLEISIGDNALIGDETVILDNDYHQMADVLVQIAPVHIEADVWLGTRVIVLRGVTIGRGSVIGAGAVVTRSVPPYTFAAGVPARPIRSLPQPR